MAITKPPVLPAWADAGDKVQPSNAELSVGWPVSSTPPSRQRFNWVLNFVANAVRYFSRRGMPDYDAAETYMTGDRVIGDDGKTYRSLVDNNTAQTPSTSPAKWERWGFSQSDLGANAQTQPYTAFTTTGATGAFVLTPSPAIAAYAANQRFRVKFHAVGNGSDTINVSGLGVKSVKQYDATGAKVAAVIVANQLADVEYDGIDFVILDPLPNKQGAIYGVSQYNTSQTLTYAADGNKLTILGGGGGSTITLPLASTCPSGTAIHLFTQGGAQTVVRQGADTLGFGASTAATSFTLNGADFVTLVSNGTNAWIGASGSPMMASGGTTGLFGANKSANGYQRFPSGLILQWVSGTATTAEGTQVLSLPIAFPNAAIFAVAGSIGVGLGSDSTGQLVSFNTTSVTVMVNGWTSTFGSNVTPNALVIGY